MKVILGIIGFDNRVVVLGLGVCYKGLVWGWRFGL